jgi:hypothetical protein
MIRHNCKQEVGMKKCIYLPIFQFVHIIEGVIFAFFTRTFFKNEFQDTKSGMGLFLK